MFLHHAFQRVRENSGCLQDRRVGAMVYMGVLLAFLSTLLAWFGFCQFVLLTGAENPQFADLTSAVQRRIAWPAHLLFLFAVALTVYRRISRPENSNVR